MIKTHILEYIKIITLAVETVTTDLQTINIQTVTIIIQEVKITNWVAIDFTTSVR